MTAQRKRVRFSWQPAWTAKIENWTLWQVKKNMWRFDSLEEVDDVMQEARMLWIKLERTYPIVNETSHFLSLYKTSLYRMFVDKTRTKTNIQTEELTESLNLEGTPNLGYLNLLLEEMPDELKSVLRALTTGRVRLKLDGSAKKLRPRENHNMRLKRQLALGIADPVGQLRSYFNT